MDSAKKMAKKFVDFAKYPYLCNTLDVCTSCTEVVPLTIDIWI